MFWNRVGWSVIIPEFQGHLGNNAFVAVISFSESRQNLKGQNQASKGVRGPYPCV
jgi:hypothetical protein